MNVEKSLGETCGLPPTRDSHVGPAPARSFWWSKSRARSPSSSECNLARDGEPQSREMQVQQKAPAVTAFRRCGKNE